MIIIQEEMVVVQIRLLRLRQKQWQNVNVKFHCSKSDYYDYYHDNVFHPPTFY